MRYLILLALLASCGKQEVDVKDSNHSISGETKSILILELPFISQVNELCKDLYIESYYESYIFWKQEVARCTFENISILNIDGLNPEGFETVLEDICTNPEYSNETICQ